MVALHIAQKEEFNPSVRPTRGKDAYRDKTSLKKEGRYEGMQRGDSFWEKPERVGSGHTKMGSNSNKRGAGKMSDMAQSDERCYCGYKA